MADSRTPSRRHLVRSRGALTHPGGPRRIVALAVVAVALVASGCRLQKETVTCLSSPPAAAASYTAAFSARGGPWNGGDVAHPIALDSGRMLWLFGDTFMDRSSTQLQHSSLVLQQGACFTAVTSGSPGSRSAPLPSSDGATFSWPVGGADDASTGRVVVLSNRLAATSSGAAGWNFEVVGSDVVTLTFNPDGTVDNSAAAPAPAPQGVTGLMWDSVTTAGGQVYVYGRTDRSSHIVARTTVRGLSAGGWQYWDGAGWSSTFAPAPMAFDQEAWSTFNVTPVDGGFLGSAKTWDVVSDDVTAWYSTTPTGPWTSLGRVADTPAPRAGWVSYDGAVRYLPGAGWTAVWSQNALDPADLDVGLYGPRFASVTNPAVTSLVPR